VFAYLQRFSSNSATFYCFQGFVELLSYRFFISLYFFNWITARISLTQNLPLATALRISTSSVRSAFCRNQAFAFCRTQGSPKGYSRPTKTTRLYKSRTRGCISTTILYTTLDTVNSNENISYCLKLSRYYKLLRCSCFLLKCSLLVTNNGMG